MRSGVALADLQGQGPSGQVTSHSVILATLKEHFAETPAHTHVPNCFQSMGGGHLSAHFGLLKMYEYACMWAYAIQSLVPVQQPSAFLFQHSHAHTFSNSHTSINKYPQLQSTIEIKDVCLIAHSMDFLLTPINLNFSKNVLCTINIAYQI